MSFRKEDRVNRIWSHSLYQEQYQLLQECEKTREFCGHSLEHFLDVARLMWIYNLEAGAGLDKELIYAAALLHDIGRGLQYTEGIPHDEAGVELAKKILPECAFSGEEEAMILSAIAGHRRSKAEKPDNSHEAAQTTETGSGQELLNRTSVFGEFLYRADKACRNCMACPAKKECNWAPEKKNMIIKD